MGTVSFTTEQFFLFQRRKQIDKASSPDKRKSLKINQTLLTDSATQITKLVSTSGQETTKEKVYNYVKLYKEQQTFSAFDREKTGKEKNRKQSLRFCMR